MNILLTCVGRRDYLVEYFKIALGNRGQVFAANTYAETAGKLNTLLVHLQNRKFRNESPDTLGALNGSYPFWGKYEPFAYPNWATKYFADALMLEDEHLK